MFKKNLQILFMFLFAIALFSTVLAQTNAEYEPTANSSVTNAKLPTGALRVSPTSVPPEINLALEKIIEAGEGKLVQGEREVLAWTENGYTKAKATDLISQLENSLSASGWKYEVGGKDGDVTFFTVLRENPTRRAVVGFFVASDEGLVVAWTEVLQANSDNNQSKTPETVQPTNDKTDENVAKNKTIALSNK